jgi:hypothetical protein
LKDLLNVVLYYFEITMIIIAIAGRKDKNNKNEILDRLI